MGVFFAEGMCFDSNLEGNGGPSDGVPHYLQRSAQAGLAAQERGRANFLELRQREVRSSPGPIGQDFSGSRTVTSRNPLLRKGATKGTKSPLFGVRGMPRCRCRVLGAAPDGTLATANFREFHFLKHFSE